MYATYPHFPCSEIDSQISKIRYGTPFSAQLTIGAED
jgi:hypothetical protein